MKKYWLTEDIRWCGHLILNKGQAVYDMGVDGAPSSRTLSVDETVICTNPKTLSCQTVVLKSTLTDKAPI